MLISTQNINKTNHTFTILNLLLRHVIMSLFMLRNANAAQLEGCAPWSLTHYVRVAAHCEILEVQKVQMISLLSTPGYTIFLFVV